MKEPPPKQVSQSHYDFDTYVRFERWASIWHQSKAVLGFSPENVAEIGGGKGYLNYVLSREEIDVTSIDIDSDLHPDILSGVTDIPCEDETFDLACAFQVLEHLPYSDFLKAVSELLRISKKGVVFSIPDKRKAFQFLISLPRNIQFKFLIPKPGRLKSHTFDGEHYWECNSKETPLDQIMQDLDSLSMITYKQYLCWDFPYHRFFIITKMQPE